MSERQRAKVVIIGAGFGGLAAAKALDGADVDVTVIDKRNHHLFQPLLYQVATAGLSPAEIAAPIRAILRDQANVRVLLNEVTGIDSGQRRIRLCSGRSVDYDWLIVATGARHSYFGKDHWAEFAPGIKNIDDATQVRRNVLLALERAETETDEDRRKALLTFVVIGGGPTGVEMAGAIAELARKSVSRDFHHITPHCSRVILVEGGPRLLAGFAEDLSEAAGRSIAELGVELDFNSRVTDIRADGVAIGDRFIPAHTVVWAAGVQASPAARWLGVESDRAGRVSVDAMLNAPGHDRVFVIGDTACCAGADGKPLPGIAPVAKQQGIYCAKVIRASIAGKSIKPFRYRDAGQLATIGRSRAVADFGWIKLTGHTAWLIWSVAHIYFLVGFRNRFAVGMTWLWHYLTFDRSARLITGEIPPEMPVAAPMTIAA